MTLDFRDRFGSVRTAQRRSAVTEIASKSPFICVNGSAIRYAHMVFVLALKLSGIVWTPIWYVTLDFRDWLGSVRHSAILTCEQKPYPEWFACRRKSFPKCYVRDVRGLHALWLTERRMLRQIVAVLIVEPSSPSSFGCRAVDHKSVSSSMAALSHFQQLVGYQDLQEDIEYNW